MPEILENADEQLSTRMRGLLALLWEGWKELERQLESLNSKIEGICDGDPTCQRLRQVPGIGPLIASAGVAAVGNGSAFDKGREFAAWLGLIPKRYSTGKAMLLGISRVEMPPLGLKLNWVGESAVRLGSRSFGAAGSFSRCGPAWIVRSRPGPAPGSGSRDAKSSRSTDKADAQSRRWFVCVRGEEQADDTRSRKYFLWP
jgi:hypothetical protein